MHASKSLIITFALSSILFMRSPCQTMNNVAARLESLTPNLVVDDVNKTIEYYTLQLGFTCLATKPEKGTYDWGMVAKDAVTIMFQTHRSLKEGLPKIDKPAGAFGTLFIRMTGIENYYTQVSDKVKIASPLKVAPYGMKEFTIRDVNGWHLTFAQEVK